MTEIQPDTSLYSTPADRLEALAKTLRFTKDQLIEERSSDSSGWVLANGNMRLFCDRLSDGWDFRLKPKPRVVWVNFYPNGEAYWGDQKQAGLKTAIAIAVRVELPE